MSEGLLFEISRLLDAWWFEIGKRSTTDWILCFAPIMVFLEIPRYYMPLVGVVIAHRLGYPRRDLQREKVLLERAPKVSVVVAGRNEGATIEAAIRSLLAQDYPNLEIIVVDDSSDDDMAEIAGRYARRGLIRFFQNSAERGRGGRPSASNLGMRMATGEILLSVDADTTFDRRLIHNVVAPFADPWVGVVAGNVMARNAHRNLLTEMQTIEYAISIDLHKRWTDLFGSTLQASGAIGAFRREAVCEIGGWDQELAEDTDVSLRMVKAGWKIAFSPEAVAMTEVPSDLGVLIRQRTRWDRGGLRTYFRKHLRLMRPSVSGWHFAKELWSEFLFFFLATCLFPFYLAWLCTQGLAVALFVLTVSWLVNTVLSVSSLFAIGLVSKRIQEPRALLTAALAYPFYKGFFRWVRVRAFLMEMLRIKHEDSFLPDSAWVYAPRY